MRRRFATPLTCTLALAFALLALARDAAAMTICLDPGHGGSDSGALGSFYTEKAANLDVGAWAQTYLGRVSGITSVGMTRTTDIYVSLADRCAYANTAGFDRFLSQHHNAATGTAQGTETYCHPTGSTQSFDLRDKVHPRLLWAFAYSDRGTKTADFYVLRNTVMPAILGEASFIDFVTIYNESQRFSTHETDHDGREGYGYCWGLCDHAGLPPPVYGVTAVTAGQGPRGDGPTLRVFSRRGRSARIEVEFVAAGRAALLDLVIRDVRGERVRRWSKPAGTASACIWDGHTESGSVAPAGVYWVSASLGTRAATARFVLLP